MSKTKVFADCGVTLMSNKATRTVVGYVKTGRMINVALSHCAPEDKWHRCIGSENVMNRFNFCETFSLPLGQYSHSTIQATLAEMFFII